MLDGEEPVQRPEVGACVVCVSSCWKPAAGLGEQGGTAGDGGRPRSQSDRARLGGHFGLKFYAVVV